MSTSNTPTLRLIWSTVTPGMVWILINVIPSDLLPDLTTVVGATLRVVRDRLPAVAVATWTCTLGTQTATGLQLLYAIQAADLALLDLRQTLAITPLLDVGSTYPFPCEEILYSVRD